MPAAPHSPAIDQLLGVAWGHHRAGRLAEAERDYRQALALSPGHASALHLLGVLLCQSNKPDQGIDLIRQAARAAPKDEAIHNNLGNALKMLGRHEEAVAAFRKTLQLKPDYPEACFNLGNSLTALARLDEAVAAFRRALALKPDYGQASHNLSIAFLKLGRWAEANEAAARAVALLPSDMEALHHAVYLANHLCDWRERAAREAKLAAAARAPTSKLHPFIFLAMFDEPELHLAAARHYAANNFRTAAPSPVPQRRDKLRIAYLSADFCDHATANLMAGLFEAHDRAVVEITAISWSQRDGSAMEARLRRAFDRFLDVHDMDDAAVAAAIRELGIDIAVDLKGYTAEARPGILALRPAPIQAAYIGYPGTMGAGFIDYALVDAVAVPADQQPFYDEKLVHLPGCYQVNDSARMAGPAPTRADCGLPEDAFVFCSFNASYKITPATFDSWMRILAKAPNAVLWLLESRLGVADHLRTEAAARGIEPARLVFAKPIAVAQHLARLPLADLFLDSLPYNAHTTTSDALWMGLPVLTCPGRSFAARVAASLLTVSGLPELIAANLDDYEAKAAAYAGAPTSLQPLRGRILEGRVDNPLFDTAGFARHLEAAYRRMQDIALAGEPPRGFAIAP